MELVEQMLHRLDEELTNVGPEGALTAAVSRVAQWFLVA